MPILFQLQKKKKILSNWFQTLEMDFLIKIIEIWITLYCRYNELQVLDLTVWQMVKENDYDFFEYTFSNSKSLFFLRYTRTYSCTPLRVHD
jgi:hypothetical protein